MSQCHPAADHGSQLWPSGIQPWQWKTLHLQGISPLKPFKTSIWHLVRGFSGQPCGRRFWFSFRGWSRDSGVPLRKRNREKRASTFWLASRPDLLGHVVFGPKQIKTQTWCLKTKDRHLAYFCSLLTHLCDFWSILRWFHAGGARRRF